MSHALTTALNRLKPNPPDEIIPKEEIILAIERFVDSLFQAGGEDELRRRASIVADSCSGNAHLDGMILLSQVEAARFPTRENREIVQPSETQNDCAVEVIRRVQHSEPDGCRYLLLVSEGRTSNAPAEAYNIRLLLDGETRQPFYDEIVAAADSMAAWVAQESIESTHEERGLPLDGDYTPPMSLTQAARELGYISCKADVDAGRMQVRRDITNGKLTAQQISPRRWRFKKRDFPNATNDYRT